MEDHEKGPDDRGVLLRCPARVQVRLDEIRGARPRGDGEIHAAAGCAAGSTGPASLPSILMIKESAREQSGFGRRTTPR